MHGETIVAAYSKWLRPVAAPRFSKFVLWWKVEGGWLYFFCREYDVQEVYFLTRAYRWPKRGTAADDAGEQWGFGDFSGVIQTHCTVRLSSLGKGVVARCGCIEEGRQWLCDISIQQ